VKFELKSFCLTSRILGVRNENEYLTRGMKSLSGMSSLMPGMRSTKPPALVWPTPSFNVGRIVE
jgi:hypothetical protein